MKIPGKTTVNQVNLLGPIGRTQFQLTIGIKVDV